MANIIPVHTYQHLIVLYLLLAIPHLCLFISKISGLRPTPSQNFLFQLLHFLLLFHLPLCLRAWCVKGSQGPDFWLGRPMGNPAGGSAEGGERSQGIFFLAPAVRSLLAGYVLWLKLAASLQDYIRPCWLLSEPWREHSIWAGVVTAPAAPSPSILGCGFTTPTPLVTEFPL